MKTTIISDTHKQHHNISIQPTELLIHCGDFAYSEKTTIEFLEWFSSLDAKYKVLIAGNHETYIESIGYDTFYKIAKEYGVIYLENTFIEIEGFKIYGSPYTVFFNNFSFMKKDKDLKDIWDKIPEDTDILITHGPEWGILDRAIDSFGVYRHLGSKTLSNRLRELKNLKFHFFGHIHGDTGIKEKDEYKHYLSINASLSHEYNNSYYRDLKSPIEINILEELNR